MTDPISIPASRLPELRRFPTPEPKPLSGVEPRQDLLPGWIRRGARAVAFFFAAGLGGCVFTNGVAKGVVDLVVSHPRRVTYHFHPDFTVADPQFRRTLDSVADPVTGGNSAVLLENGDEIAPAMLGAIRGAVTSVNLETYVFEDDSAGRMFADALIATARRGVEVRVLVDGWGGNLGDLAKEMKDAGVACEVYRPVRYYSPNQPGIRTHRKLLVVDGRIGFTGGFGIGVNWLGDARNAGEWRDTQVRVTGPVVGQMQSIFAENWTFTTGELLAGDLFYPPLAATGTMLAQAIRSSKGDPSSLPKMMYFMAIQAARESIHIENAYFLPDAQVRAALVAAAGRGVEVKVIVPGPRSDVALVRQTSRSHYGELLEGGVEIHEYGGTMMHNKTIVVDGIFSTIGSINFDTRSMNINAEESLSFYDREFGGMMESMFARDLTRSHAILLEAWKKRGLAARLAERISWIWEPYY